MSPPMGTWRSWPLLFLVAWLAGCASTGGIRREPFADVKVPDSFIPYSDRWVFIQTPQATAARLVYMTSLSLESAFTTMRDELVKSGWTPGESSRFVNSQGFRGISLDFTKGPDGCRATAIEGPNATHVELAVARLTRQ